MYAFITRLSVGGRKNINGKSGKYNWIAGLASVEEGPKMYFGFDLGTVGLPVVSLRPLMSAEHAQTKGKSQREAEWGYPPAEAAPG